MFADFYTPADSELIPTGEIRAVAGTRYDFRGPRPVRNPKGSLRHQFCRRAPIRRGWPRPRDRALAQKRRHDEFALDRAGRPVLRFRPRLRVPVLAGARYGAHAGLCLEPQVFPDSPNSRIHRVRAHAGGRIPPCQRISLWIGGGVGRIDAKLGG